MILTPAQRLSSGERTAYEVVEHFVSNRRHEVYLARKAFWNYRERDRSLYEADEDERLDVLIQAPRLDGPEAPDPSALHVGLDFELERVLSLAGVPGLPEPLDRIELPVVTRAGAIVVPLLVLAHPHSPPISTALWRRGSSGRLLGFLREFLMMLGAFEDAGLAIDGELDDADLLVSPSGRWTFLATSAVRPIGPARPAQAGLACWTRVATSFLLLLSRQAPAPPEPGWASVPVPIRLDPGDSLRDPERDEFLWLADRLRRATEDPRPTIAELCRVPGPRRPRFGMARALGTGVRRLFGRGDRPAG
jgi:hypothetical protein